MQKVCKNCGIEQSEIFFKFNPKTGLRHSFCSKCVSELVFGQIARYWHYRRPEFKPTQGYNPFPKD